MESPGQTEKKLMNSLKVKAAIVNNDKVKDSGAHAGKQQHDDEAITIKSASIDYTLGKKEKKAAKSVLNLPQVDKINA